MERVGVEEWVYAHLIEAVDRPRLVRKFKLLFHLYPHKPKNSAHRPVMKKRSWGSRVEPEINLLKLLFPQRGWGCYPSVHACTRGSGTVNYLVIEKLAYQPWGFVYDDYCAVDVDWT